MDQTDGQDVVRADSNLTTAGVSKCVVCFAADIDECPQLGVCGGGECVNLPGSYRCRCTGGLRATRDQKDCQGTTQKLKAQFTPDRITGKIKYDVVGRGGVTPGGTPMAQGHARLEGLSRYHTKT